MQVYRKKRELANWIRRRLGAPVIDVVIDTTQIDDCIDQACLYFGEFAGGIGNKDSILLISPERVFYDGTGNANQPSPIKGRWRTYTPPPSSYPTTSCPPTTGPFPQPCPGDICQPVIDTAEPKYKYGGPDGNPWTNFPTTDANGNPCPEEALPGPGWCGDGIQDPQCFTEIGPSDPNAIGPFWVEGDTTAKPQHHHRSHPGWVWKSVYDIPSDVIGINEQLTMGYLGGLGSNNEDNALFAPAGMLLQAGGSWGLQSPSSSIDNRWGFWMGSNGGFVDIVGWELAMQYIEMFRQLFTIKMAAQLISVEHKVRLTPPPCDRGLIALSCTRKVADEYMYENQFVKEYAYMLTMRDVGMNLIKYGNVTLPDGSIINGEVYLQRSDALREKLEEQMNSGMYSEPPDFYVN